jgi:protein involved in temperature-dependent protein secretion
MTPLELYRAGELREAIKALGEELRKTPLDAKRRTFLFELFVSRGNTIALKNNWMCLRRRVRRPFRG